MQHNRFSALSRNAQSLQQFAASLVCIGSIAIGTVRPVDAQTLPPAPKASKVASGGTFTDKGGMKHRWQINAAHALIWDESPYLPIGGSFSPHSFAASTEEAWQEDVKSLTLLKSKTVQDLIIASPKPLQDIPIASFQRLIDYLDTSGFRYGISFGPGLTAPLSGTVVKPSTYRFEPHNDTSATWIVTNGDRGAYFLVDANADSKIFQSGNVTVTNSVASLPIEPPASITRPIGLLLPHKTLPVGAQGGLPDLWTQFDAYRDQVLLYLSQVKFGAGLRFFDDPITRRMGFGGETEFLIPESDNFRLEWEGYLSRTYASPAEAHDAWSLMDNFKTFAELSRLVPMWANNRGFPYFYDPVTQKTYRRLDPSSSQSRWWDDFQQCRTTSIAYYMNAMANMLKHQIADVPVVYTWTQIHPVFTNNDREGGFDGLGIETRGMETSRLARITGPAFSQADQAARTVWFLTTALTGDAGSMAAKVTTAALQTPDASQKAAPLFTSYSTLTRDMDDLKRIGVRGIYVDTLQTSASDSGSGGWLDTPESLTWLSDYSLQFGRDQSLVHNGPSVLYYPQNAPGPAHIGAVPGASSYYWLPSAYAGDTLDWWPAYSGYTIRRGSESSVETVLMSLEGRRTTRLLMPDNSKVRAYSIDGTRLPLKMVDRHAVELVLDATPTIFTSEGQPLIPQQAAEETVVQLGNLYELAMLQKIPAAENARAALEEAKRDIVRHDYGSAYPIARNELDSLIVDARPYIWIEGEQDILPLFSEFAAHPEASGLGYRRLATPNPAHNGYAARYTFEANHSGRYEVWMACSTPGVSTSHYTWKLNNAAEREPADPKPHGQLYLNDRFGWVLLGSANIDKGVQNITILIKDRAKANGEYTFSIDALMITDRGFVPNTTVRPKPVEDSVIKELSKTHRKEDKRSRQQIIP